MNSSQSISEQPAVERRAEPPFVIPPAPAPSAARPAASDRPDMLRALIGSRQNVSPKRLVGPGPTAADVERIFLAAAAAPDHGTLTPWRFVVIPSHRRSDLAEVFALALIDRDPGATLVQIEAAREKAHRAPWVAVAIARLGPTEPDIPPLERMVSMGCALQNILLTAHALGFGVGLTSGQAMRSPRMAALLGLVLGEEAVCCVNVGSVTRQKPGRERPAPAAFVSVL